MITKQLNPFKKAGGSDFFESGVSNCRNVSSLFDAFRYLLKLVFSLTAICLFTACGDEEMLKAVTLPDGTVIYAHPTDNHEQIAWETDGNFYGISALSDIPNKDSAMLDFDGEANTRAIVEQLGKGTYAARICNDLKSKGHKDWYLPSTGELIAVLEQLDIDSYAYPYWSSTEADDIKAWAVHRTFVFGEIELVTYPLPLSKNEDYITKCRCVRR